MSSKLFLTAVWLALGAASAAHYREDLRKRRAVEGFQARFTLDRRRPLESQSIWLAPSGDWACGIAAESVLSDAVSSVRLPSIDPALRNLWLEAVVERDDEI